MNHLCILQLCFALFSIPAIIPAVSPADPDLIPEARNILTYFESIYEKKTLMAVWDKSMQTKLLSCTGRYAAIFSEDMTGRNNPRYGKEYSTVIRKARENCIAQYNRGGLLEIHFHWPMPLQPNTGFYNTKLNLAAKQWDNIIKPGTAEYKTMLADFDWHVDSLLQPLANRKIPVIFRPLHEIDGGWFWWTCKIEGKKHYTAILWKILFNHLTKTRKLHNLIWNFNVGYRGGVGIEERKAYYPGDAYCDIVSIDLYRFDPRSTGTHSKGDTYRDMFIMMKKLGNGKMVALGEAEEIPNMSKTASGNSAFAPWLYALPWWFNGGENANGCGYEPVCNPCSVAKPNYTHTFAITLDELPDFKKDAVGISSQIAKSNTQPRSSEITALYNLQGKKIELNLQANAALLQISRGAIIAVQKSLNGSSEKIVFQLK